MALLESQILTLSYSTYWYVVIFVSNIHCYEISQTAKLNVLIPGEDIVFQEMIIYRIERELSRTSQPLQDLVLSQPLQDLVCSPAIA